MVCVFQGSVRDHPRLRGEHTLNAFEQDLTLGSPPPTRGTRFWLNNTPSNFGITPAYAGNTRKTQKNLTASQDHPRLRGEHYTAPTYVYDFEGSPPPTRGTLVVLTVMVLRLGITPAYAGNTYLRYLRCLFRWDHPRLRGEHSSVEANMAFAVGSPPPTRGTPYINCFSETKFRITPAYAGNTICIACHHARARDHPPPTRGTRDSKDQQWKKNRITPAYAGNTLFYAKNLAEKEDHPRLRGEHFTKWL